MDLRNRGKSIANSSHSFILKHKMSSLRLNIVVYACHHSYSEGKYRRIAVQGQLWTKVWDSI
jgi:hypothetical protein